MRRLWKKNSWPSKTTSITRLPKSAIFSPRTKPRNKYRPARWSAGSRKSSIFLARAAAFKSTFIALSIRYDLPVPSKENFTSPYAKACSTPCATRARRRSIYHWRASLSPRYRATLSDNGVGFGRRRKGATERLKGMKERIYTTAGLKVEALERNRTICQRVLKRLAHPRYLHRDGRTFRSARAKATAIFHT